jgi:AraC-like DNA-binding protein/mannose-6-phosphate isomerase-like protein (cupin superfamily)
MASSGQTLSPAGQAAPRRDIQQDAVNRPLAGYSHDYARGHDTGLHHHAKAQLLYATQGAMRVETESTDYVVPAGRALWMPAGWAHRVRMAGAVAMRALFLREDAARVGPVAPTAFPVPPLLRELILAACAMPLEWDEAGRGAHLAALILDEIAGAVTLPLGVPAARDPRLRRLAETLRANPADDRTLEEWGEAVGASGRTLARLFLRDTGLSFAAWRQALRLSEASALLAEGMAPARVAARVGYASAPAFGAAYRAAFGVTPRGRGAIG